jgi:hypothetical protein
VILKASGDSRVRQRGYVLTLAVGPPAGGAPVTGGPPVVIADVAGGAGVADAGEPVLSGGLLVVPGPEPVVGVGAVEAGRDGARDEPPGALDRGDAEAGGEFRAEDPEEDGVRGPRAGDEGAEAAEEGGAEGAEGGAEVAEEGGPDPLPSDDGGGGDAPVSGVPESGGTIGVVPGGATAPPLVAPAATFSVTYAPNGSRVPAGGSDAVTLASSGGGAFPAYPAASPRSVSRRLASAKAAPARLGTMRCSRASNTESCRPVVPTGRSMPTPGRSTSTRASR